MKSIIVIASLIAALLTLKLTTSFVAQIKVSESLSNAPLEFPKIPLKVGGVDIITQWANTERYRMRGLMDQSPPLTYGMLLEFDSPQQIGLWMKNTPAPLDVAFINADWVIIGFASMDPYSEVTHHSPGSAIAALEMPRGWFAQNVIALGDSVVKCSNEKNNCYRH